MLRILQNYKYTGAMVNFKVENATIRAKVQKKNRPEDWVVVECQHEAIVSHEEFRLAGESIRKVKSYGKKKGRTQPLPCYCGHCGRRLRRTYGLDEYYSCATQLYQKNAVCSRIQWSKANLEEVLAEAFRTQLELWEEKLSRSTGQLSATLLEICVGSRRRWNAPWRSWPRTICGSTSAIGQASWEKRHSSPKGAIAGTKDSQGGCYGRDFQPAGGV